MPGTARTARRPPGPEAARGVDEKVVRALVYNIRSHIILFYNIMLFPIVPPLREQGVALQNQRETAVTQSCPNSAEAKPQNPGPGSRPLRPAGVPQHFVA